ncbi:MAG: carboxypeptidase regulatory-like domain-containing protein [Actinobacteria bacterium]|nr:carboxypeptidase regulatory-like domain-containing protein [Actinomycetota bacterium]
MPRYGMVVDVTRCNGCYNCFIACKDEYCGIARPGYSAPQPMTGQTWMKILPKERGQFPKVKQDYIAIPCMQCEKPGCAEGSDGAVYKRGDGIVMVDPEKAKDRPEIVSKCPYRVIYWNEIEQVGQKCTFCAHLLDAGWKEPRCVEACPTGTLIFGDLDAPDSAVSQAWKRAEAMHPEYGMGDKVRFIGLPKNFVAGAVVFGDKDECAKGATVTLEGEGREATAVTDGFGDFEFEGLPGGASFTLSIAAPGYMGQTFTVKTSKSIYLGDIILEKSS